MSTRSDATPTLSFDRRFSSTNEEPAMSRRTATIKDDAGKVIFTQEVSAPVSWSDTAVNVVASKYFYGDPAKGNDPSKGGREESVAAMIYRVASTIATWGERDGYFSPDDRRSFQDELSSLLLHQHGSFNSPVWFNVGLSDVYGIKGSPGGWRWDVESSSVVPCLDACEYPQGSACFLQSISDDMASIADLVKSEMMLFKAGSGTGTDLSPLRSSREKLSGGGKPSGPVSFMEVYDAAAGVIKSGGRARRSAKMQILRCDHPDIVEFVECKVKEEAKARALIAAGYDSSFNGEAYRSIRFQNANLSVSATDEFMRASLALDGDPAGDFRLVARTTGDVIETVRAADLLHKIAESAWRCGDPGMFFVDTVNRWHTSPANGPITTANPCGEFTYVDDSACNLASLNLMKFRRLDGTFDVESFRAAVRIFLIGQEIIVDRANYPTEKIALNSHRLRPLGLGYCGLGALIMSDGLPYDSDAGRSLGGAVTAIMHAQANLASIEMAKILGPFDGYAENRDAMLAVMEMHKAEAFKALNQHISSGVERRGGITERLWQVAAGLWQEVTAQGPIYGFRNGQVTLCAPTGTIAFKMDSGHSTGMEPSIALVQYKTLAGGGMIKIVNPTVRIALKKLGYSDQVKSAGNAGGQGIEFCDEPSEIDKILAHVEKWDTIEDIDCSNPDDDFRYRVHSGLKPEHLPIFDCAFPPAPQTDDSGNVYSPREGRSIAWQGHVKMLAALQPFLSGSQSKTINMPASSTIEDVKAAYHLAWSLGVKDVAIFRDGSKESQPVSTGKGKPAADVRSNGQSVASDPVADDPVVEWVGSRPESPRDVAAPPVLVSAPGQEGRALKYIRRLIQEDDVAVSGGKSHDRIFRAALSLVRGFGLSVDQAFPIMREYSRHCRPPWSDDEVRHKLDAAFRLADTGRERRRKPARPAPSAMLNADGASDMHTFRTTVGWSDGESFADPGLFGQLVRELFPHANSMAGNPLGSRSEGVLATLRRILAAPPTVLPRRERLPDTRSAVNHKMSVAGVEAYITVGHFPDGRPGELFVTMAKEGSTLGGMMDSWATSVSIMLQYGVPPEVIVAKFSGVRFEPMGITRHPDIPFASSPVDYVARWVGLSYIPGYRKDHAPDRSPVVVPAPEVRVDPARPGGDFTAISVRPVPSAHGPLCPNCGSMTVPTGPCFYCPNCHESIGGCG